MADDPWPIYFAALHQRDRQNLQRAYNDALVAAINTGLGAVMTLAVADAAAPLKALCVEIRSLKDED